MDYPAPSPRHAPTAGSSASGEHAAGALRLRFGVVSTTGTVREHNEDRYYVPLSAAAPGSADGGGLAPGAALGGNQDSTAADSRPVGPPALFIVADGMGGQQAGEKASSMAVEQIPRELHTRLNSSGEPEEKITLRAIRESVASANQEILSLSSLETEFANMGTTVVLALFQRQRVFVSGIGDSRAYRLREGQLEQLTRDHSLADALGEAGTITKDEVPTHKFKNVLYLYLGSKDARGGPEEVRVLDVRSGDRFMLCSDGLTGVVKDERLAEVVGAEADPQRAAQTLVEEAVENLSKDNITCVVIHVDSVGP